MASLYVVVTGCEIKRGKGKFFVMAQLDQTPTSKEDKSGRVSMKKKTDECSDSQFPTFSINTLIFPDVVIFHQLILKIGIFEIAPTEELPSLLGTNSLPLTTLMIEQMSRGQLVKESLRMISTDPKRREVGVVGFVLRIKAAYAEQKAYQEVQKIRDIYYDPFEKNPKVIKEKLAKAVEECEKRQEQLKHQIRKLDEWNRAMRDVARDLEVLRRTKDNLETANEKMLKQLNQMQNVDEIHIEYDILSTTEEGKEQLRERMMKILARMQMEERRYQELQAEYFHLKKYLETARKITKELEEAKSASKIEQLHYDRSMDLMYIARTSRQTVACQEAIVSNLSKATKFILNQGNTNSTELNVLLDRLRFERRKLEEKQKQIEVLNELHGNRVPRDLIEGVLGTIEEIELEDERKDEEDLESLRERQEELTREAQMLSAQLSDSAIRDGMRTLGGHHDAEDWEREKALLLYKIEIAEKRGVEREQAMIATATKAAEEMAFLKHQIAVATAKLQEQPPSSRDSIFH